MLKTYDHAITRAELKELLASSVRQMLEDAPHDASLQALVRRGVHQGQSAEDGADGADDLVLSDDARQTLAWIEALDER